MKQINPNEYRPKYTYDNANTYRLIDACNYYDLEYPKELEELSDEEIPYYWNGIGGEGCWYNDFIPDTVWGLDISLASGPHDIAYHVGETEEDRTKADEEFLRNMYKIIDKESTWALKWVRKRRVYKYYLSVRMFGKESFWKGKIKKES